ncbi:MAG: invasin domain 3-containing protein [Candidatus Eisenbacteria bacterium]
MIGIWFSLGLFVLSLAVLLACEAKDEGPTGPGTLPTDDPVVDRGTGTLLADGTDTKEVYAYVFSEWGAPLEGIAVRFTTSVGTITPSAVTDRNGRAWATLRSVYSASDLTAHVCASIPDRADSSALPNRKAGVRLAPQELFDVAKIVRFETEDAANGLPGKTAVSSSALEAASRSACLDQAVLGVSVSLAASPGRIPADGVSASSLRAVLSETTRGVPIAGSVLGFASSAGSIEGEKTTDGGGGAVVRLTSGTSPDTADVGVYIGTARAAEAEVRFAPIRMILSPSPGSVNADGESGSEITATLLTEEMAPLAGLAVSFETDRGVVSSPVTTGTDGKAVATLTSTAAAGVAVVTARFADALVESVEVRFVTSFLPARLVLMADPSEIVANGVSTATLRAAVSDSTGIAVPDGTPVRFVVLSGGGTVSGLAGTAGGTATMTLTSGTASGPAVVRAYADGAADTVTVRYVPGAPSRIALAADPGSLLANGLETSTITAVVFDAHGNRAGAGVEVGFAATRGTIEPGAITDSTGTTVVSYTAGFGAGQARITATAGAASGQIVLSLLSNAPAAILLDSLSHEEIRIQGTGYPEASSMVFRLVDCYGVPIGADRPTIVGFELVARSAGGGEYLCCLLDTTDAWGRVRTALHSGTAPGVTETIARIVGSSPLVESQVVPVAIHGTLPHPNHLDIDPDTLNIPGLVYSDWTNPMVALVYDRFSNPVPAGTAVYFSTNYCGITGSDVTDERGQAFATFVSMNPYPPDGLVTITAQTADSLGNRISNSTVIRLSGPTAPIVVDPTTFAIADGGSRYFTYQVRDVYGNPLTHHTLVEVTSTSGTLAGDIVFDMPDVISGHTGFSFYLADAVPGDPDPPLSVFVTIRVTSVNGNASITISGTID